MTEKHNYPKIELCANCKAKLQRYVDHQEWRHKRIEVLLRKARHTFFTLTQEERKELHDLITEITNQSNLQ